jgi:hypothetical protein
MHPVVLFYKLLLNCACLNTTTIKTHSHFTMQQMSLLVLCHYIALHVLALKAIIWWYTLSNIFLNY